MKTDTSVLILVARASAAAVLCGSIFGSIPIQAALAGKKAGPAKTAVLADLGEAKRIIRASLIDPNSAQFEAAPPRSGITEDGVKTLLVCGTYNAKNRFGGYVGRVFFVYSKSAHTVFTSNVAKLGSDGSSLSLSSLSESLRGTPSMDQISAVQAQGSELQKQVKFWLGQCES